MLQGWLELSDAEWAVWSRAPSADSLWAFGVLGGVILIGLGLFAFGVSRRRWKGIVGGLILTVPAAMLTAVFLETAVEARRTHAGCVADGGVRAAGQRACAADGGGTLIHVLAEDDGFEGTQYYWTADGLCAVQVSRRCRTRAAPVDRVPPPGMEAAGRPCFDC